MIKKISLGIAVLLVAGILLVWNQLGNIIRTGLEDLGPGYLGAAVQVEDVDISLISGTAAIKNFRIGAPEGFTADPVFSVADVSLKMDVWGLLSDTVSIQDITIDSPAIAYEIRRSGTNLSALQNNLAEALGAPAEDQKSVIIDDLYINNARVRVAGVVLQEGLETGLPDIHMEDIGREEGGTSLPAVANRIFRALIPALRETVMSMDIGNIATGVLSTGTGIVDKAGETLKKGIKGLLGGSDDKDEEPESQN